MAIRSIKRFLALLAAALALAACSSATFTRLAYNNAAVAYGNLGPMLAWMVDDYVDIAGQREDWVRVRIDRVLGWHRAEELPRYREFFESMLAKSSAPYRVGDIASHQREVRAAYHRLVAQAIPDTAEFIANMNAADVAHLERKFAEDNRRFTRESVRGTPGERLERRARRFNAHLESWVGRLEPGQRALVEERYRGLRDLSEEFMGERRFRQSEILALARSDAGAREVEAKLRHLLLETDAWRRPEYVAKLRERDAQVHQLVADLSATLSDRQRAALQDRIRRFLDDISTLTARA